MVFNRKLVFSFLFIVAFSILAIILLSKKEDTLQIISRQLDIKIPSSAKVLNSDYDKQNDYLGAKIQIPQDTINSFRQEVDSHFGRSKVQKKDLNNIPIARNINSWWDLNVNSIEVAYHKLMGKKVGSSYTTREVWIFISKDKNGDFMLYLLS
jgi:hypothetical protein